MDRRKFLRSSLSAAGLAALPGSHALAKSFIHTPTAVPADIDAVRSNGSEVTLAQAAVQELSDSLKGKLLLPSTPGYDDARFLLQTKYDKYPALVVQPVGAADVQHAVDFARDNELLLAVKCGGHAAAGTSSSPPRRATRRVLKHPPWWKARRRPASPAAACSATWTMKRWRTDS